MFGACISPCTTWWPTRRGTTKKCWRQCGSGVDHRRHGFSEAGEAFGGVAGQYCGELGKSDNCQAAVSLSVSTWNSSLPIAWRLYLPEVWCEDAKRCRQAGIPKEVAFQTKPEIALEQIRQAKERRVPVGVVLADAGYGKGTQFRTALTQLGLQYIVALSLTPQSGNRGNKLCRTRRENQAVGHRPNVYGVRRTINQFRSSS